MLSGDPRCQNIAAGAGEWILSADWDYHITAAAEAHLDMAAGRQAAVSMMSWILVKLWSLE